MQLQIDAFLRPKDGVATEPVHKKKATSSSDTATKKAVQSAEGTNGTAKSADKKGLSASSTGADQPSPTKSSFPFALLSEGWKRIEDTTKRLEKNCEMVKMLLHIYFVSPADIIPAVLLSTNQPREPWSELPSVLNFADANLRKVIAKTFGSDVSMVNKLAEKCGDIGNVAERIKKAQNTTFAPRKPLYIAGVYSELLKIADTAGPSSIDQKSTIISNLLYHGNGLDTRYISRVITGKFRLGFQKKSMIPNIADMLCCVILASKHGITSAEKIDKLYEMLLRYGKVPMSKNADDDGGPGPEVRQKESVSAKDHVMRIDDSSSDLDSQSDSISIKLMDGATDVQQADLLSLDSKNLRTNCHIVVARAYSACPSFDVILTQIISYCGTNSASYGKDKLGNILSVLNSMTIKPGIPVLSMLARPTTNYSEILKRIADEHSFSAEYKYDGFRAQVHYDARRKGTKLQVFSRLLEDMSKRFPDVLAAVLESFTNSSLYKEMTEQERASASFVIDGEICPINADTGLVLPFQYLSRREKDIIKAQKEQKEAKVRTDIVMYVFDLLFLNGKDYMSIDLRDRKEALYHAFAPLPHKFEFAKVTICTKTTNLQDLLEDAVQNKTEGLIVKILTSRLSWYRPDERSHAWLKLKKDYLENVGDSFDLVPVAAWMGAGKRTGVLGAYLLAAYNDGEEQWETVCQLGTGFSDADLAAFHEYFTGIGTSERHKSVSVRIDKEPDLWFDPEASQVWEVKCANLSLSKKHTLCFNAETDQGIALRLPRLIKTRPDKKPWDSTRADVIFEAFTAQPERL